jgi:polycomb protein EED
MGKRRRRQNAAEGGAAEEGGDVEEGCCEGGEGGRSDKGSRRAIPRNWTLTKRIKEDHGQVLFGLAVNLYDERWRNLFATTGANRASIYELLPDGNIDVRQVYVDEDRSESFFCCAWTIAPWCKERRPLLAIAGQLGIIRILDLHRHRVSRTLMGHGNAINEVRFHPYKPALLLSASKDESIRLWNVVSCVCVALFTGDAAHRGEVLSIDFHLDGHRFASGGMDNAIKVWSLQQCQAAVDKADALAQQLIDADADDQLPAIGAQAMGKFRSAVVQMPWYSTCRIHRNYVDCVRWHGDLLLTKSTHSKVVVWKPAPSRDGLSSKAASKSQGLDGALVLGEYHYNKSDIWFLRFGVDPSCNFLVVGNMLGHLLVYDLNGVPTPNGRETLKLHHSQCNAIVRQTAVSYDSKTILAVTEDGSLWRWDATKEK